MVSLPKLKKPCVAWLFTLLRRLILYVVEQVDSLLLYASESECSKLASKIDNAEENYRPPLEAQVIGNSRLYFHSAPSSKCKVKGIFVIKGDSLTIYKSHDGWVNGMFIGKYREDFIGGVQEKKSR
ncbi:MAG: hypothetical protein CTY26_05745 [Methylophilus sp.]|nr:MAG: hypothetical protein CTY26_05745 [Methylophilus sp.]